MAGLADQLVDGSISSLESAAPWRRADADRLEEHGRRGAALYLRGYIAEIRLCTACYRVLGFNPTDTITDEIRRKHEKAARDLNLMARGEPHHLPGWARYLAYLRQQNNRGLKRTIRELLLANVEDIYEQWRPRLRYKPVVPTMAQQRVVRTATDWIDDNYTGLWN